MISNKSFFAWLYVLHTRQQNTNDRRIYSIEINRRVVKGPDILNWRVTMNPAFKISIDFLLITNFSIVTWMIFTRTCYQTSFTERDGIPLTEQINFLNHSGRSDDTSTFDLHWCPTLETKKGLQQLNVKNLLVSRHYPINSRCCS